jgi:hypothetical protein
MEQCCHTGSRLWCIVCISECTWLWFAAKKYRKPSNITSWHGVCDPWSSLRSLHGHIVVSMFYEMYGLRDRMYTVFFSSDTAERERMKRKKWSTAMETGMTFWWRFGNNTNSASKNLLSLKFVGTSKLQGVFFRWRIETIERKGLRTQVVSFVERFTQLYCDLVSPQLEL